MPPKIIITIKIPVDQIGCAKCDAEKISRFKKLLRKHVKELVEEQLKWLDENRD
jgi:uncharacterized phage-like protein YoqJ